MPSPLTISIRIQPHLVNFLESLFGSQPISFPRKNNFNRILNKFMEKEPATSSNYIRSDTNLEIQLPYFEDKNVLYNFNLSAIQESVLVDKIENTFKLTFRDEMDQYRLLEIKTFKAIQLFMEKYSINQDSYDMLIKDYQRYRNSRYVLDHRKIKKISSVKSAFCPVCH